MNLIDAIHRPFDTFERTERSEHLAGFTVAVLTPMSCGFWPPQRAETPASRIPVYRRPTRNREAEELAFYQSNQSERSD